MNAVNQSKIIGANNEQRQAVIELLRSEKLPVGDLPATLDNFFVAVEDGAVIGAIGVEQYEHYGLLRSMVVDKKHRNRNIASQLVSGLEKRAIELGINTMYLLTETAPHYFEKKGYQPITRKEVPASLKSSSEFRHVCPVSAIVMKKPLDKNQQAP